MNKDEKREIIKLAAKAAGINIETFTGWNPVDDDADAFKLAVMLEFDVQQEADDVMVLFWVDDEFLEVDVVTVDVGDDRLAATREAITTAAAVIGKIK